MDKKVKPEMSGGLKAKIKPQPLDIKIAAAVAVCLITVRFIPQLQYAATCFAAILCMQDETKLSFKTGINRLIVTVLGGAVGIAAVLADNAVKNPWFMIVLAAAGIIVTILACRLTPVPPMLVRIGCVTFILVLMVSSGTDRIVYALWRAAGTVYGVAVALLMTFVGGKIFKRLEQA